jgi:hypothetical protein
MIYLSLTTTPSRIQYFLEFYNNIMSGSVQPDKIILNVYTKSLQNELFIVPESVKKLQHVIINKHNQDYGPILKFFSVYNHFVKSDDIFIYCDDDFCYDYNWLENIVDSVIKYPMFITSCALNSGVVLFHRLRYLSFNGVNSFVRGFGGVGFYKKTIMDINKSEIITLLNSYERKLSDDLIISYFFNKYCISCRHLKINIGTNFTFSSFPGAISKGANNTLVSNKKRYYDICNEDRNIMSCFTLYSYLLSYNLNEKDFKNELNNFKKRLERGECFSFVRFNDGEMKILRNKYFTVTETKFDISFDNHAKFYDDFKKSILIKDPNYFIGIPCFCCEKKDKFREYLYNHYTIPRNQLTFANIFVNSNYYKFYYEVLPLIKKYKIVLICNEKANVSKLSINGFEIVQVFYIPDFNAFTHCETIYNSILDFTNENKIENHIFLFCAGCLSNVLVQKMFVNNSNNFYIDIGSALDRDLGLGNSRNYNRFFSWKILSHCLWNFKSKGFQLSCFSQNYSRIIRNFLKMLSPIYTFTLFIYYMFFYYVRKD